MIHMSRCILLWGLAIGLVAGVGMGTEATAAPAARPNILFIFTDDHAQRAISAYGSVVNQTPHLERLQQEYGDTGLYADPSTWPKTNADAPSNDRQPLGRISVAEAIAASRAE